MTTYQMLKNEEAKLREAIENQSDIPTLLKDVRSLAVVTQKAEEVKRYHLESLRETLIVQHVHTSGSMDMDEIKWYEEELHPTIQGELNRIERVLGKEEYTKAVDAITAEITEKEGVV